MQDSIKSTEFDGKKRTLYLHVCRRCESPFYAPKQLKRIWCSIVCSSNDKRTTHSFNCAYCGTAFQRSLSYLKKSKSGLRFCSRVCKDTGQRLESGMTAIHPPHYGTAGDVHTETYRAIAFRHHPARCNRCGYDRYKSVLRVHHKDRDRTNRSSKNLEILCPTCHEEEHFLAGDGVYTSHRRKLVEPVGYDPTASEVQTRRSPK